MSYAMQCPTLAASASPASWTRPLLRSFCVSCGRFAPRAQKQTSRVQSAMKGITAILGALAVCAVRSNSRPEQIPKAMRNRRMAPAMDRFRRASAGKSGTEISPVLLFPASPSHDGTSEGRTDLWDSARNQDVKIQEGSLEDREASMRRWSR